MSEVRGLLERAQARFPAPDRVMDRLIDRRDRKRRHRRIVSAVIALVLAALALGGLLDTFRTADERHPASNPNAITLANVTDLHRAWVGITPHTPGSDDGIALPPVVEGNRVYVDSKGFFLYAFGTSCGSGGASCEPLWISLTPDATQGLGGRVVWPPATADGRVYLVQRDQAVFAFPASCGSQVAACRPLWAGPLLKGGAASSPVIGNGIVYAFAAGTVYAFPTSCGSDGATCTPLWTGATVEKGTVDPARLTVAEGVLYVAVDRALYAFPATCGGARCEPIWHTGQIGDGGTGVQTSPPIVSDGMVFVSVGGGARTGSGVNHVAAFSTSCSGACPPSWTWSEPGHGVSVPVVEGGTVYVTRQGPPNDASVMGFEAACRTDGGVCAPAWVGAGEGGPVVADGIVYVDGGDGLLAYGAHCATGGSTCTPEWVYPGVSGQPAVSGGLLFVAPTEGHVVLAYEAHCSDGRAACSPIWRGTTHGRVRSGPVVTREGVYVGTEDGQVVVFRLSARRSGWPAWAVAGGMMLVLVLVVGAFVRRRRRA